MKSDLLIGMGVREETVKGVKTRAASAKSDGSPASLPHRRSGDTAMYAISVNVADELVERIAHRAAELMAAQSSEPADDGWLRGAERIASYIDAPRSRVYALVSAKRIPVHHDGSALIARRSELDKWLLRGGGRRP
jgi:hypothetical protein